MIRCSKRDYIYRNVTYVAYEQQRRVTFSMLIITTNIKKEKQTELTEKLQTSETLQTCKSVIRFKDN